jgi:proline iminopeptidase
VRLGAKPHQPRARTPVEARYAEPRFRMCFARLITHYWRRAAWRIPAVLVCGRLDRSSPPDIAGKLAQVWPAATLHIVPDVGHYAGGTVPDLVANALGHFAALD